MLSLTRLVFDDMTDDMTMDAAWKTWKTWIVGGLGLRAGRGSRAVGYLLWQHLRAKAADAMRAQRDALALQAKLLKADVDARRARFALRLPQAGKDCDAFYQQSFLDSADRLFGASKRTLARSPRSPE